ncbi:MULTISPECIES: hypothetical protein [Nocardiopsis]|uniref:Uncharacterized protein n=1 Tax=Nocardiopsis tropica TaxID=109330 RepID=A0ABV1ZU30_9ACTN|nr:hypothetical protein [Nocardiopsis tropica]
MRFELVEVPGALGEPAGDLPRGDVPPMRVPVAHEIVAVRMRERTGELRTRLTSIIEAVRPALNRMDASIVRSERELADTGHDSTAEPPQNFRGDRFSAREGGDR